MAQNPSVLILGAGELGLAVLEGLVKSSKRQGAISMLLRRATISTEDPAKKKQNEYIKSLGVKLEAGDVVNDTPSELIAIFKRYDIIISCTGFSLPSGTQLKISKAVLDAEVPRYFPWQFGLDYDAIGFGSSQDVFDEQLEVRALLRGQTKVDWIIVSPGLFMSFLFIPEFGPVDLANRVLRALGSWDNTVSVTTPQDIGAVVAEIVYDPRDISHQVAFVSGDTATYGQVADMVEKRFGGQFRRELWDLDALKKKLSGDPENKMFKYQSVFAAGVGVSWDFEKTLNAQRGVKLEDIPRYLEKMHI